MKDLILKGTYKDISEEVTITSIPDQISIENEMDLIEEAKNIISRRIFKDSIETNKEIIFERR